MKAQGEVGFAGELTMKVMRADGRVEYIGPEVPTEVTWELLMQKLRLARIWRKQRRAVRIAKKAGIVTFVTKLEAKKWNHALQRWEDYGVIGRRVVTTAGVNFLVDDWDNDAEDITLMHFHDSGIGVVGEAVGDIDLGTPAGPTTRATGVESQPNPEDLQTVATITYTGTLAITEHGIFNTASRATDNLWDRTVFAAINVVNLDAIQFTYTCTVNSGG